MSQIIGRDALGATRVLSVCASTEEEARGIARQAGIVTVDRLGPPPSLPPSRLPKLSGFTLGCLSLLGCVGAVILGAVIGAAAMKGTEPPGFASLDATLRGGLVGSIIGLVCGIGTLVAGYHAYRGRR